VFGDTDHEEVRDFYVYEDVFLLFSDLKGLAWCEQYGNCSPTNRERELGLDRRETG
jgi:hypothetical protein